MLIEYRDMKANIAKIIRENQSKRKKKQFPKIALISWIYTIQIHQPFFTMRNVIESRK